ncbi:hypothetical protein HG536_0B05620 [Torulaspora globosa]|uniref:Activator of C kinase protein 1 n=1 Tax=Torulaspora globosa TaxID=48254 RepID=A0A7G3ZDW1_9SACH|nr:uncharacterized protein HG536_0B05620 [Torulaspora globosa]QLL31697.1 hypothetical protein HG536_0B05620 [Torulaspora globosa]
MSAAADGRSQNVETVAMHPYKKHFLDSQNHKLVEPGSSRPDANVSDRPTLASSPVGSDEQSSTYGSVVSLNNSSQPSDVRSQWIQQMGPPSNAHLRQLRVSPESTNSSSEDIQRASLSPSNVSSQTNGTQVNKRKSRSVDLSHMYLMNGSHDTQLTSTNESVADMSHQLISRYLGQNGNTSLVPRLKTIEMYRENVKKSKDANLLFQFAQYILQTALTMEFNDTPATTASKTDAIDPAELKRSFLKEAQHYLRKLSVKGYADAQYLLGDVYASGALGKTENKEAFTLFQAAAKHGHIESAYRTAYCFEEGLGTTRDSRKALEFLKFAASRNHPSAMYKLGLYSFYGRMGLPTDVNTKQNGIKWLSRASARANELTCAAPYELAKIYEEGFLDIIIPDEKYATELYIQAASLGHVPSSTLLGQIYESGNKAVPQDTSLSIHYYTQAALKGDPVAMLGLCAWYLLGAEPAFEKDENEAFQWALRAASAGYPKAQFTVGYFYEKGKGCEANIESAYKWYGKAAKNNDSRAIAKLKQREPPKDKLEVSSKKRQKKSMSVSTLNIFKSLESGSSKEYFNSEDYSQLKPTNGLFTDAPVESGIFTQAPNCSNTKISQTPGAEASKAPKDSKEQPHTQKSNVKSSSGKGKKKSEKNGKSCILM